MIFSKMKSHFKTLSLLGLHDYLKYIFLKRFDPFSAKFFYARHVLWCDDPFLKDINIVMRRGSSASFSIWISLREHVIINYVLSEKDLYVLTDFSVGGFKEIFCDKLYDIKDPSSYEALVDIGSTFGEFTLYMMIKGFRGGIITVEPFARTFVLSHGRLVKDHKHLSILIDSSAHFEEIFKMIRGEKSIIKIDCEGCEKHLKPQHLQMLKKGSILIIEAHDLNLYQNIKQMIMSVSGEIISEIKTENNIWIIKSLI